MTVVPNGVDTDHFRPLRLSTQELALLRQWLVDEPLGWDESGQPGSIRYTTEDLAAFVDPVSGQARPVLLYVGRFTRAKRLPLLLRAYARVRLRLGSAAPAADLGRPSRRVGGRTPIHARARTRPGRRLLRRLA